MSNQREEIAALCEKTRLVFAERGLLGEVQPCIDMIASLATQLATEQERVGMLRKALREIDGSVGYECANPRYITAKALATVPTGRLERLEKRHQALRNILLWTEEYLRIKFKGLHLGRLKKAIEADDRAALEEL